MKTMNFQKMMILVLAAAVWTGCAKQMLEQEAPVQTEDTEEVTTVQFTASLAPKGESVTKAVGADGTTTWAVDEQIAIYYQTASSHDKTTATVSSVDGSGNATITATLKNAKNKGLIKFVYPASLHNGSGGIDATESGLLTQNGTLEGISSGFDAATGSGKMVVENDIATTDGSITMTNQLLIGKFTPKYGGEAISGITKLTVNDGTRTYTATASDTFGTDGIYVAMLPIAQQEVILMAETASQNYGFGGKLITLEQGKFYTNLAIPMLKAYDLSAGNVTTTEDAFIYQSSSAVTTNTVTVGAGYKAIIHSLNYENKVASGITCSGDATLVLSGSNVISSYSTGSYFRPAIKPGGDGTTLTIKGPGSLIATGGCHCAAIGGGFEFSCGNISIEGGTITAIGGANAPGIGAGHVLYSSGPSISCGDITISGGSVTAIAGSRTQLNGADAPGIGSSNGCVYKSTTYTSSCGNITITDGITELIAIKAEGAPAPIGHGSDSESSSCGTITIDEVENPTATSSFRSFYLFVTTTTSTDDTWTLNHDGNVSGTVSNAITIPDGGSLTLSGMTLNVSSGPAITCLGDATIVVTGENTVSSSADGCPAIQAGPSGKTLTIQGGGVLTATGASGAAGIGAAKNGECGNITVSLGDSGVLNAIGGAIGAGIGSGYAEASNSSCGNITLNSGTINATGGSGAAGIGSGVSTESYLSYCGQITIGLVIQVKAIMGSGANAPIGLGYGNNGAVSINMNENIAKAVSTTNFENDTWTLTQQASVSGDTGDSGDVTVSVGSGSISGSYNSKAMVIEDGATITLSNTNISATTGQAIICLGDATIILTGSNTVSTSADGYPAIQAGGSGTTLTITGSGRLTATGGYGSAGIGSGMRGTCGDITISGGEVTATGGTLAAGIGSGVRGTCGAITISGGAVTATGGFEGAGIGSGLNGSCGAISISGGAVTATGGGYAAGIGSGYQGKFSSISIGSGITSVEATMGKNAQAPIGMGYDDKGSGSVTIDNTLTKEENGDTWTLTPKSQN